MKTEQYPKDWARVELMVSPLGELHAISGDRENGPADADLPFIGLERIKSRLAPPLPSIGDGKDGETRALIQGMRDKLVLHHFREEHTNHSEIIKLADAWLAAMSATAPKADAGREEKHGDDHWRGISG